LPRANSGDPRTIARKGIGSDLDVVC